jgi:hypothetical protein
VHRRGAALEDLLEVAGQKVPAEVVVVVAVGAENNDSPDPPGGKHCLQGPDVNQVLAEGVPLRGVDRTKVVRSETGVIDMLFRRHSLIIVLSNRRHF